MRTILTLLAACFLLYACDSSSDSTKHEISAPKDRDTLVRSNTDEPESIDPQILASLYASNIALDLFEGLVNVGPNGEAIPGVATHWETNDGITHVFHLRHNAKWSDGTAVTAQDFVYGWQRAVNPATSSKYSWYVAAAGILNAQAIIDGKQEPKTLGVKAIDDYTLEVTLESPKVFLPVIMTRPTLYPAPRHVIEKYGDKWTQPGNMVSNGAYQLKDWVVNERIVLTRNPHYWDNANTSIDNVVFLPLKSQTAALKRYMADEIDMTFQIPVDHFKRLREERPNEVKVSPLLTFFYYGINSKRPPFNDVRVRKALNYAIDRDKIVNAVLGQGELPVYGMIPDAVQSYSVELPEWAKWTQDKRNQKAQSLLKEAGFDKQHSLKFSLLYNTNEISKKLAIATASMWEKVLGCEVTFVNQEFKTYLESRRLGLFDVAREAWAADYNEGISMLDILRSNTPFNDSGYTNPEFDALLNTISQTQDDKKRLDLYHQAERLVDQDTPIIPVYQWVSSRLVKPYVRGYRANTMDFIYSKDLSFAPASTNSSK